MNSVLPRLICSVWLLVVSSIFAFAVPNTESRLSTRTFSYDESVQASIAYDGAFHSVFDYDLVSAFLADEKENPTAGTSRVFPRFAESIAAKTGTAAADDAAKWIWGQNKGVAKSIRQMEQRGWNPQQVTDAIKGGQQFPAKNLVNPGNPAVRYVNPQTGQSVVQDTVTKEIIHFGGPGFKY